MTAAPDIPQYEIAVLRRQMAEALAERAEFVRKVQEGARKGKLRGWCGEVEAMLDESDIPSQWRSTGTITMEVAFEHDVRLELVQPRTIGNEVMGAIKDAVAGMGLTLTPKTAVIDGEEVVYG